MKKTFFISVMVILVGSCTTPTKKAVLADADNAGLKLPAGFGALIVADSLGKARHITVTPQGDIYTKVNTDAGGKSVTRLRDTNGDGKADEISGFGAFNGKGITIKNG